MKKFLLITFLVGCEGNGCTPGDFIAQCAKTCGDDGVLVVLPTQNVCTCQQRINNERAH